MTHCIVRSGCSLTRPRLAAGGRVMTMPALVRNLRLSWIIAFATAAALPALAAPGTSTQQMIITSADHDTISGELTIHGSNFGSDPLALAVTLAGDDRPVLSGSDTELVIDGSLYAPGVYALIVRDGNSAVRVARRS